MIITSALLINCYFFQMQTYIQNTEIHRRHTKCYFFPAVSLADDVIQTPKLLVALPLDNISLTCEHTDTSKYTKLWYRQKMGEELVLMGLTNYQDKAQMEKKFEDKRFTIFPEKIEKSILIIDKVTVHDNAIYYCASSIHSERRLAEECPEPNKKNSD